MLKTTRNPGGERPGDRTQMGGGESHRVPSRAVESRRAMALDGTREISTALEEPADAGQARESKTPQPAGAYRSSWTSMALRRRRISPAHA